MLDELMKISETRETDAAEEKQAAMAMFERMCQLHEGYIGQITELNANSNPNLLQHYRSSRNMAEQAELVLESSNSSNTNNSLKKTKYPKLKNLVHKSSRSGQAQLRHREEV